MEVVRRAIGTTVVVALVIVIIVGATGAYFLVAGSGSKATTTTSASTTTPTSTSASTSGSTSTSTPTQTTSSTSTSSTQTSSSSSTTSKVTTASTTSSGSSTTSCTSTTTSTTGSFASEFNFTGMFHDFSSITVHWNGTETGNNYNVTSTYTVLAATSRGYRVNVTLGTGGTVVRASLFAWRNGSASWVFINGANETGSLAFLGYFQAMSAFLYQALFASPSFTSVLKGPGLVKAVSTSVIMIGGTSVNATTYEATTLPLVTGDCGGTSVDFTKFSLQLGTVAGKTQVILTHFDIAGTFTNPGANFSLDVTLAVTSLIKS